MLLTKIDLQSNRKNISANQISTLNAAQHKADVRKKQQTCPSLNISKQTNPLQASFTTHTEHLLGALE